MSLPPIILPPVSDEQSDHPLPAAPILLSVTPAVGANGMLALQFDTAMIAGSGKIWITDGAAQTVIDRETGLPTLRIAGATDTHVIAASSASISGGAVTLHVSNLLAGHDYHVFLAPDALRSADGIAFGGVRIPTDANTFVTHSAVNPIAIDDTGAFDDDGITNDYSTALSGHFVADREDGMHVEVRVGDGFSTDAGAPDDDLGWSYASDAILDDGTYTVVARLFDKYGHVVATADRTMTIDTLGPSLASWSGGATEGHIGAGSDLVLHFSEAVYLDGGSENAGAIWLDNTEDPVDGDELGAGAYVFSSDHRTLTIHTSGLGLAAGNHYLLGLDLYDAAGNEGGAVLDLHIDGAHIDVTPPTQDDFTTDAPAHGVLRIGDTITIHARFNEAVHFTDGPVAQIELTNHAHAVLDEENSTSTDLVYVYTVQAGDASTEDLYVLDEAALAGRVADDAGNALDIAHVTYAGPDDSFTNGRGIAVDASVPTAPAALSAPVLAAESDTGPHGDSTTSLFDPLVTGSGAEAGATVTVYVEGEAVGTVQADEHGDWTYAALDLPGGGTYHVSATQNHNGLESAAGAALALVIDAPPAAGAALAAESDSGSSDHDGVTHVVNPVITGSGEINTLVTVYDGDTQIGEVRIDNGGIWQVNAPVLSEGPHTIRIAQTDLNGHTTPKEKSIPLHIVIDTAIPDTPATPAVAAASDTGPRHDDGITSDATPTLAGTAEEPGGTVKFWEGDWELGSADVGGDRTWSFTPELSEGLHYISVQQIDAAGNGSAWSEAVEVRVDRTAPGVTGSFPMGWTADGAVVVGFTETVTLSADAVLKLYDDHHALIGQYTGSNPLGWFATATEDAPYGIQFDTSGHGGAMTLEVAEGHLVDLAGNAVLVGIPGFTIQPLPPA